MTIATLDPAVAEQLSDIRAHAGACGRLDCGHLGRSTNQAVRRAVLLYQAGGAGIQVNLDHESAEVVAVVGVLRESQHARITYVRGRTANGGRGYVPAIPGQSQILPDANKIRITPQRADVYTAMLKGMSANQVATAQHRTLETVKSHAGWLRRLTGAHDATSALLALVLAGKLVDRALPVVIEDEAVEA